MKKILFLHGFYASRQCVPAIALREAFAGRADVLTYNRSFHFPGGHTPTADEVRAWYVPLAERMLSEL